MTSYVLLKCRCFSFCFSRYLWHGFQSEESWESRDRGIETCSARWWWWGPYLNIFSILNHLYHRFYEQSNSKVLKKHAFTLQTQIFKARKWWKIKDAVRFYWPVLSEWTIFFALNKLITVYKHGIEYHYMLLLVFLKSKPFQTDHRALEPKLNIWLSKCQEPIVKYKII